MDLSDIKEDLYAAEEYLDNIKATIAAYEKEGNDIPGDFANYTFLITVTLCKMYDKLKAMDFNVSDDSETMPDIDARLVEKDKIIGHISAQYDHATAELARIILKYKKLCKETGRDDSNLFDNDLEDI